MSWYDPKDARRCWPEGEYDAVVENVVEHTAKESGNLGRKVTLRIYNGDATMVLSDYLMAGEKAAWKIKEFARAIGQVEMFDAGTFDPIDFKGSNIRVKLKVEDGGGDFGEQNKVGKYLAGTPGKAAPAADAKPTSVQFAKRPTLAKGPHEPLDEASIPF